MPQYGMNKLANINGIALGGTTPETLQQILAAQYVNTHTNPIVGGGFVTGTSGRTYNVSAGVGLMKTGAGAMMLTWGAGPTKLVDVPSTTRTDVVVIDASGQIDVKVESSFDESKYIVLDRRILPAGATATSRSTSDKRRNYALPASGSLAWFAASVEYLSGVVPRPTQPGQAPSLMGGAPLRFWTPTDRFIDIYVEQAIYGRTRDDNGTPYWPESDARSLGMGWMVYEVLLDGALLCTEEIGYNAGLGRHAFRQWSVPVSQGDHEVRVQRVDSFGREPMFFSDAGRKRAPGFVGVRDAGVQQ